MVEAKQQVLITGITGFLGSWTCKLFLEDGRFKVRGTVRDKNNEKKIQPLKDEFGDRWQELEIVEADLSNEQSIIDACAGCDIIVHTASPFPMKAPKNEDELIKPAVNGALAAMKGAQMHQAKRVIFTSSAAALFGSDDKPELYNESTWSNPKNQLAYEKSKTLAEKACWDFHEKLPEAEKFDFVAILPVGILGPTFIKTDFTSGQYIAQVLEGKFPGVPVVMLPTVDVRDVAQAHLEAAVRPEAANQRFIISEGSLWFREIATILVERFGTKYGTKTNDMGYWMIWLGALFDKQANQIKEYWGKPLKCDNSRSKEVLGIDYKPAQEYVIKMAETLIENGIVKAKK